MTLIQTIQERLAKICESRHAGHEYTSHDASVAMESRLCAAAIRAADLSDLEPKGVEGATPRTEAMIDSCRDYEKAYHYNGRFADFARQLERELAGMLKYIEELEQWKREQIDAYVELESRLSHGSQGESK